MGFFLGICGRLFGRYIGNTYFCKNLYCFESPLTDSTAVRRVVSLRSQVKERKSESDEGIERGKRKKKEKHSNGAKRRVTIERWNAILSLFDNDVETNTQK